MAVGIESAGITLIVVRNPGILGEIPMSKAKIAFKLKPLVYQYLPVSE